MPAEGLFLGRLDDNDVTVDPQSYPGVSGRHARLILEGRDLVLEDLDSKNGTLIKGQRVMRRKLSAGEVFELGPRGPAFRVRGPALTDETTVLEAQSAFRRFGNSTVIALRRRLGIPEDVDVQELVEQRSRRNLVTTLVIALLLVTTTGAVYWGWQRGDRESLAALRDETNKKLESIDPAQRERDRLAQVSKIEDVVCLIESTLRYRDATSGEFVHSFRGSRRFNLDGRGSPFEESATGTGFCVSAEGWVVTNAHVVHKEEGDPGFIEIGDGQRAEADLELWVTFSGTMERHRAELERWVRTDKEDLALLRIAPFEGMPHFENFETRGEIPALGSDVFVIGFPLGKDILHEGSRVFASTFRGIVSRTVDYYIQVDAAVHHGVSGGPVIDAGGRLIGVVTGMQALDSPEGSSAIGYVIPIREVATIWPPK